MIVPQQNSSIGLLLFDVMWMLLTYPVRNPAVVNDCGTGIPKGPDWIVRDKWFKVLLFREQVTENVSLSIPNSQITFRFIERYQI
jgi:hypothetical protein